MQDEVNEKCVMVTVNAAKMTAEKLCESLARIIRDLEVEGMVNRMPDGRASTYRGKVMLRDLSKRGELSDIEITDGNIRSFERYARKYDLTYALKKDRGREPPRYHVFFKAKDVAQMEAAFREYTGDRMGAKKGKPSVIKRLREKVAEASRNVAREPVKVRKKEEAR